MLPWLVTATERPEICVWEAGELGNLDVIAAGSKSQVEWEQSSFKGEQFL